MPPLLSRSILTQFMLPILRKIQERWPVDRWGGLTVLIGCSGGADSTALVRALHELKPSDTTLLVGHFNHRLRGLESDADEAFVVDLAAGLGLECCVERVDSDASNFSDEASLRELRYAFLERTAARSGARYVAVAHTADDGVETTLHNLIRGTGLKGLAGIAPYRDLGSDLVLIRPMLDLWRNEVEEYLRLLKQAFRVDSSNLGVNYTRNRIRHQLIPIIEAEFGLQSRPAVRQLSLHAAEVQDYLAKQGAAWLNQRLEERSANRVRMAGDVTQPDDWPAIQSGLVELWHRMRWPLQGMTAVHWKRVRQSLENDRAKPTVIELPGKIKMSWSGDEWWIERELDG